MRNWWHQYVYLDTSDQILNQSAHTCIIIRDDYSWGRVESYKVFSIGEGEGEALFILSNKVIHNFNSNAMELHMLCFIMRWRTVIHQSCRCVQVVFSNCKMLKYCMTSSEQIILFKAVRNALLPLARFKPPDFRFSSPLLYQDSIHTNVPPMSLGTRLPGDILAQECSCKHLKFQNNWCRSRLCMHF